MWFSHQIEMCDYKFSHIRKNAFSLKNSQIPQFPRFSPKDVEIPNLGSNSPKVGTLFTCWKHCIESFWKTEENRVWRESPGKQSLAWNFPLYWIYFLSSRIFEQLALALKNRVCLEFTVLNIYFLSFRVFEQLALALRTAFALNSRYWIYFLSFRILSNLRLPWIQSLPWNFSRQGGGRPPDSYTYDRQT